MGWEVLLFVPNIIGYIRIILASTAILLFYHPIPCTILYGASISLDIIDGYAARKLNQTSTFGAWWGYLVIFIEWITFISTHSRGSDWKIPEENFPRLVKMVMSNGFKTPMGFFAVGSLHLLPLWLYMYEMDMFVRVFTLPVWVEHLGIIFFTVGRTVCLSVELFYVFHYIKYLVEDHSKK